VDNGPVTLTSKGWYAHPDARLWRCAGAPAQVADFHAHLPNFHATPLVEVPALAGELDVGRVFVKDESTRLGLPAFKALGASWAVYQTLSRHVGLTRGPATLVRLRRQLETAPPIELVTATDGNHGRAVAWVARLLGVTSRVFVPTVVHASAVAAIASEGAEVTVVDGAYDEAVRMAARATRGRPASFLVQDTSWPGYEEVPRWVVDGYSTLLREVDAQLAQAGVAAPDLVAVPVGVGSLAQAVVTHYRSHRPAALLSVEPANAACVLASLAAGAPRSVPTGTTIMAGLNCGTPSAIAWPYMRDGLDAAIAVTDSQAAAAMATLAGSGVPAGPCGAASLAGVRAALGDPDRRSALAADATCTVVLLSTDGSPDGSAQR
jgi:diaminopropionate ammonia-lyase